MCLGLVREDPALPRDNPTAAHDALQEGAEAGGGAAEADGGSGGAGGGGVERAPLSHGQGGVRLGAAGRPG